MNKDVLRQWLNVAGAVATIAVNGLAVGLPLNGQSTSEISDRFKVYFVPEGYVFSIWGLIYLGLLAFAIYQVLPAQRENPHLRRIGYWFVLSCVANCTWLFLWHYNVFSATIVAMLVLLVSLIAIYLRLEIGRTHASAIERWCVHVPFSVYLGWITVATIANATELLYYWQWNGWGVAPEAWAVIMLVVALLIATAMSLTRGDIAYMLVLVWAFAGIALKQAATPLVAISAWVATGLAAVIMVVGVLWRRRAGQARPAAG